MSHAVYDTRYHLLWAEVTQVILKEIYAMPVKELFQDIMRQHW